MRTCIPSLQAVVDTPMLATSYFLFTLIKEDHLMTKPDDGD